MATVIERERPVDRGVIVERDDSGWAVALIVVVAMLAIGAFVWARYYSAPAPVQQAPGANIEVTLPQTGGTQPSSQGTMPGGGTQSNPPATN